MTASLYLPAGVGGFRGTAAGLFDAIKDDVLATGDVELALQKAFRWGYDDPDQGQIEGLRQLTERLREQTRELRAEQGEEVDHQGAPREGIEPDDPRSPAERIRQLDALQSQLRQIETLDDLDRLDPNLIDTLLTPEEQAWIEQWKKFTSMLVAEGYVANDGRRLELTPRAIRRIGNAALRALFTNLPRRGGGDHPTGKEGTGAFPGEGTRLWHFGDSFDLHLGQTLSRAVLRSESPSGSLKLTPDDFVVLERESSTSISTVLLVDMSRSMYHSGCWDAARQTALALDALIRNQFPRDSLDIVGFSERARPIQVSELPGLRWNEYAHGTNLEDGLDYSRSLLKRHATNHRQILVITDGEPTACNDGNDVRFEDPPGPDLIERTLRAVRACTRDAIAISVFLLERNGNLDSFTQRMMRITRGHIVHVMPGSLGKYILRDFGSGNVRALA